MAKEKTIYSLVGRSGAKFDLDESPKGWKSESTVGIFRYTDKLMEKIQAVHPEWKNFDQISLAMIKAIGVEATEEDLKFRLKGDELKQDAILVTGTSVVAKTPEEVAQEAMKNVKKEEAKVKTAPVTETPKQEAVTDKTEAPDKLAQLQALMAQVMAANKK